MKPHDEDPLSNFAFNLNLRHYNTVMSIITLGVALVVFAFAYYAYRHEAINHMILVGRCRFTPGTRRVPRGFHRLTLHVLPTLET